MAYMRVIPSTRDDDHERLHLMHLNDVNEHKLKLLMALGNSGWLLCVMTTMGGFEGSVQKARDGEL
jgi:hypothetical protein